MVAAAVWLLMLPDDDVSVLVSFWAEEPVEARRFAPQESEDLGAVAGVQKPRPDHCCC